MLYQKLITYMALYIVASVGHGALEIKDNVSRDKIRAEKLKLPLLYEHKNHGYNMDSRIYEFSSYGSEYQKTSDYLRNIKATPIRHIVSKFIGKRRLKRENKLWGENVAFKISQNALLNNNINWDPDESPSTELNVEKFENNSSRMTNTIPGQNKTITQSSTTKTVDGVVFVSKHANDRDVAGNNNPDHTSVTASTFFIELFTQKYENADATVTPTTKIATPTTKTNETNTSTRIATMLYDNKTEAPGHIMVSRIKGKTEPPHTESPTTESPTTDSLITESLTTEPSTTETSSNEPPAIEYHLTQSTNSVFPTIESSSTESSSTGSPSTASLTLKPPTTESPANESPTTESPNSEDATTESLTNEYPNTDLLTNESPTTDLLTNKSPTTDSITNESPTTESPTNESPTNDSSTNESPTTDLPTIESHTTDSPTNESATADSSTNESPTTESPTNKSPTTESPTNESPTTDSLINDSTNTDLLTNESPTTDSLTNESPTTDSPTNGSPTIDSLTYKSPTTDSHTNESPTTDSPTNESPTTESPTNETPTTDSPTNESPTTDSPTNESPTTESPTNESPTMDSLSNESPSTESSPNESPTAKTPTTESPSTESPTIETPTTESPTNETPTTESSTNETPTTETPTTLSTTLRESPTRLTPDVLDVFRKPLDIMNAVINAEFDIKFKDNYTDALDNQQSDEFKNTSKKYEHLLKEPFQRVSNFKEIIILGFWRGSIGVRYKVVLKAAENNNQTVNITKLIQDMQAVKSRLMAIPGVDPNYVNQTFDGAVTNFTHAVIQALQDKCLLENICEAGYECDQASQECFSKCKFLTCSDRGECYIGEQFNAQCRCRENVTKPYEGDDCSTSPNHVGLSQNEVIAIGTGLGGAVFIISVIVAMAIYKRKQRNRNTIVPSDDESDESTTSVDLKSAKQDLEALERSRSGNFYINPKRADITAFRVQSAPSAFDLYPGQGSGRGSINIPRVRPLYITPRDRLWHDGSSLPSLSSSTPGRLQSWTGKAGTNNYITLPEERSGHAFSNFRQHEHR